MIVFDLLCGGGHRFEGWFNSSSDFDEQGARGLIACPECGRSDVAKAPMAPSVPTKGNARFESTQTHEKGVEEQPPLSVSNAKIPPEVAKVVAKLAEAQKNALKNSKWVGKDFAERSRAIHYGERAQESIHGEATPEQAQDLIDEGISVAPLPFPVTAPEDLN